MLKRIITALIICTILTVSLCGTVFAVQSDDDITDTSSYNEYTVLGSSALCTIPKEFPLYAVVPAEYKGAKVTKITCHPDVKQLTTLTVLAENAVIGSPAFSNCTLLSSITLNESIRSITENAFTDTYYYNQIGNWDRGALYIGTNLIKVSDWLEGTFTVREGTTLIADGAFRNCKNLNKVIIPSSVRAIGVNAFAGSGVINNPEYYPEDSAFVIGDCFIAYEGDAKDYTLPEGIRIVADKAFESASALESLTIPEGVTDLGQKVFTGTALKKISLPQSLEYMGPDVFSDTPLTEITVAKGNMNYAAFNGILYTADFKSLIKCPENFAGNVTVHADTENIEAFAFKNCRKINEVTLPNNLLVVGSEAFLFSSVTKINLPAALTDIYDGAFAECEKLTEIYVPDGVDYLGSRAFAECTSLKKVSLGKGITKLEDAVFLNCSSMEIPEILGDLYYVSEDALKYTAFTADYSSFDENGMLILADTLLYRILENEDGIYRIPEGIEYISSGCFEDVKNGKKLYLPMRLKRVDKNAYSAENGFEYQIYPGHTNYSDAFTTHNYDYDITTISSPDFTKTKVMFSLIVFSVCMGGVKLSTSGKRKKER